MHYLSCKTEKYIHLQLTMLDLTRKLGFALKHET